MTGEFSWELNPQRCVSNSHIYLYLWRLSFLTKITILCFVGFFFFFFQCSWKSENSWAWAGWWSYELCVFQNLNLLFCFRLRALFPPPPRLLSPFQRLLPRSKAFSPVVLVIWCKYPKCVSFLYAVFLPSLGGSVAAVRSMQQWEITTQITMHGQKERC